MASAASLARQLGAWRPATGHGAPSSRRPAYLSIAEAVRLLVLDGRVPVGTALPSERALAAELGVSRTTVTAAYADLRESGHLQSRQGMRSVLSLPVAVPAEPADAGHDAIALNVAAPAAPDGIVQEGYRHAVAALPPYLSGTGVYPTGIRALREAVAIRYTERGLPTRPEQILVTAGAQHALRIVLDAVVSPGERVVVEQPTHHGTLLALRRHRARAVPLGLHPERGWDLDQLEAVVRRHHPRMIFTIADFHNPTGLLLDAAGRAAMTAIAAANGATVVVDETMAELGLDAAPPPPVAAFARRGAHVVTIGSASKTVWAGLRIGWIRADEDTIPQLAAARYELDLAGTVLEQLAAAYTLGHLDDFLPARRRMLLANRSVVRSELAEHLPGATTVPGPGGLCLWVALPAPLATATATAAARRGVRLTPGSAFTVDGAGERHIRIPYTLPEPLLRSAVATVGAAYREAAGAGTPTARLEQGLVV
ncbi:PLP-dependent aminotransferase family protein [Tsukamurella soli]|uniref:PLP-dependent aminotransferase family protein n=1 Tax=Tsukamurella soli TaxID=644556 RepID=A0ABP8K6C1_9ACTN